MIFPQAVIIVNGVIPAPACHCGVAQAADIELAKDLQADLGGQKGYKVLGAFPFPLVRRKAGRLPAGQGLLVPLGRFLHASEPWPTPAGTPDKGSITITEQPPWKGQYRPAATTDTARPPPSLLQQPQAGGPGTNQPLRPVSAHFGDGVAPGRLPEVKPRGFCHFFQPFFCPSRPWWR